MSAVPEHLLLRDPRNSFGTRLTKYLLLASFIGSFAETMLTPIWTSITMRVGGGLLEAGIGYGLFSIATGAVILVVGRTRWFTQHLRASVFWGFLLSALADLAYVAAHQVWHVFIVQAAGGLAVGLMNPAWDTLFSEDMEEGEAASKWTLWSGGVSVAMGIAALVGGFVVSRFGFNALFYSMAAVHFGSVYYAYRVWRLPTDGQKAGVGERRIRERRSAMRRPR
jgi:MFS family permease